jgi:hypothetical protein
MKRCNHCQMTKPRDQFGRHCRFRDGRRSICKTCQKAEAQRRTQQLALTFAIRHPERATPGPCIVCGQVFLPRRRGGNLQKYCSKKCSFKWNNIRPRSLARRQIPEYRSYMQAYQDKRRRSNRARVFFVYGGECVCCGETERGFLTIDHIQGGGTYHRKTIGAAFYEWLIRNRYPDDFRILCMNCNWARRFSGICPHERIVVNHIGQTHSGNGGERR